MQQLDLMGQVDYLMFGMMQEYYKNSKDLNIQQDAFAKELAKDIRLIYDKYMPNVHVLDATNTAKFIINGIYLAPEEVFTFGAEAERNRGLIKQLIEKNKKVLVDSIVTKIDALHKTVVKAYNGNPVDALNKNIEDRLSAFSERSLTQQDIVRFGQIFMQEINGIFGNNALLGVANPADLGIFPQPDRFIFFQRNFLAGKDRINKEITSGLRDGLIQLTTVKSVKNSGIQLTLAAGKSITGKYVNFGHVGGYDITSENTTNVPITINTPALAKIVLNGTNAGLDSLKVTSRDVYKAKDIFLKKTGHIKQSIDVSKQFSERTGVLFRFGMTMTTDMDVFTNQTVLGQAEKKQVADRFESSEITRQMLAERFKDTVIGKTLEKLLRSKSSQSAIEFITNSIVNNITGKKRTHNENSTKNKTKAATIQYQVLKTVKASAKAVRQPKTKAITSVVNPVTNLANKTASQSRDELLTLRTILDSLLTEKIRQNMGSGNRRDILNLRSGRFAESVEVPKLSQSRQGTITAYYTYMKNPYATFSQGGRQQYPRSRDPKLLITRSIRELAGLKIASRLRMVAV
jgi:hypothetical protein